MTVNRFCSSGLQTIAMAAQRVIAGEGGRLRRRRRRVHLLRAAGDEHAHAASTRAEQEQARDLLDDAADRRDRGQALQHLPRAQDEYGAASQQRACAAQAAGKFDDEIVPITVHGRRGRPGDGPAHEGGHGRARTRACATTPPTKRVAASSRRCPAA